LTIFNAPNAPIGGFQVFLNIRNNGALLLDLACLQHLNVPSLVILPYKKSQTDFENEMKTKLNYVVKMRHYWNNGFSPKVKTKMIERVKVQTHFQHIKIIMYSPYLWAYFHPISPL
jgi:hypothetical protein